MKIYTIIGGVNGVGKSSFTGVLKECTTNLGIIIDVDKITAELGGNTLAGGKAASNKIRDCIARNVSFTQETPLSGYKTEATAKQVKKWGTILECSTLDWTRRMRASQESRIASVVVVMTFLMMM